MTKKEKNWRVAVITICTQQWQNIGSGKLFHRNIVFLRRRRGKNAHISMHVNTVIDEITRHYVSERTNRSLGSISSCLTTHCIIYIEVQSYFIWCWQLFLELWVKSRHERVSRSRVRLCVHACVCVSFCLFCQYIHTHPHKATSGTIWTLHILQVNCQIFFLNNKIWFN